MLCHFPDAMAACVVRVESALRLAIRHGLPRGRVELVAIVPLHQSEVRHRDRVAMGVIAAMLDSLPDRGTAELIAVLARLDEAWLIVCIRARPIS